MQASDREEFKAELLKLCAGFGVPCTRAREDAYWTGLAQMSIHQFRKCVEFALGGDYAGEEFPKTGQIWKIYKGNAINPNAQPEKSKKEPDHLAYFARRLLWLHVSHRGGLGSVGTFVVAHGTVGAHASSDLERCLKFKRELVAEFCGYIREGDECATPATFVVWWLTGLSKIADVLPRTKRDLELIAEAPESQAPFPAYMARELEPQQSSWISHQLTQGESHAHAQ